MSTRTASITRNTNETQIELSLNLDGTGAFDIQLPREAGAPFWQHMLEQWSKHGRFDLTIKATGDVHIDGHHLIEDLGIALGKRFSKPSATSAASRVTASSSRHGRSADAVRRRFLRTCLSAPRLDHAPGTHR
jgi:imidazoleglycerol phosphate dehydratase HisB